MLFKHAEHLEQLPFVNYALPADRAVWNGLFLVGEAPGKEEVRLGLPFVGRSGQLLNELLAESGIDRNATAVANVFRFQPPGNKVDHFLVSRRAAKEKNIEISEKFGSFGSLWCKKEYAHEIENLINVITHWKPMIIMALGRTPFWALTGQNSLIKNAGKLFDCRFFPGTPVLPTFHPSFILRGNWSKRPEWLEHFLFAAHYVAQK